MTAWKNWPSQGNLPTNCTTIRAVFHHRGRDHDQHEQACPPYPPQGHPNPEWISLMDTSVFIDSLLHRAKVKTILLQQKNICQHGKIYIIYFKSFQLWHCGLRFGSEDAIRWNLGKASTDVHGKIYTPNWTSTPTTICFGDKFNSILYVDVLK